LVSSSNKLRCKTFVSDGGKDSCGIEGAGGDDLNEVEGETIFSEVRGEDFRLLGPIVDSIGYRKYNPMTNKR